MHTLRSRDFIPTDCPPYTPAPDTLMVSLWKADESEIRYNIAFATVLGRDRTLGGRTWEIRLSVAGKERI
jgi:hypothetical protein